MQSRYNPDPQAAATENAHERAADGELAMLRNIFRLLPSGVTIQDEKGQFLLVNDAAAAQLGIAATAASHSKELDHRRETGIEVLRSGRTAVAEESVGHGPLKQVLLTTHR